MGSENVVEIDFRSNDKDTLKSLNNQHLEILRNQRALIRMGSAGNKSFRQVKSGAGDALGTLGKFAGAITGVGGVVGGIAIAARQLFVEFNRIKELQQSDADKQVQFENSLVKAVRNAGGFYGGEEIKKIALDLEADTGASPTKIAESLSSAFSARGATNKQQAQEAVAATAAALKYAPDLSQEDTADLAGAGIDLSKRFGFTPEESLGYLKNVGSLARVVDPQKLSDQVAPAITNLANYGNTAPEAGSLIAAITQGSADKNAARSGTAAIQLAAQLRERGIGESTAEGIDILANDPKLRKKFMEGGTFNGKKFPAASFEKKAEPAIEQLFQPGSVTSAAFKGGIKQIGGKKEAREAFDTSIAENASVTQTSRIERQSKAAAEASGIKDEVGGLAAVTRNALGRAFDEANFSDVRKKALIAEFEARSYAGKEDPLKVGESLLEKEQSRLLATKETISAGTGGGGVVVERKVSDEDRRSAAALRSQEVILEREQNRIPIAKPNPAGNPGPVIPLPKNEVKEKKNASRSEQRPIVAAQPAAPQQASAADNKVLLAATKEQTGVIKELLNEMVKVGEKQDSDQRPQVRPPLRHPAYQSPSASLSVTGN